MGWQGFSFLSWVCMQFNLWMKYWVNLWVNWLLVQVAFSNPAQPATEPILISYLKPGYISPLDPNLEGSGVRFTGRSARGCTEIVIHSTLPWCATAMRPGADSSAMTRAMLAGVPGKDSPLLRESHRKRETCLSQMSIKGYKRNEPEDWGGQNRECKEPGSLKVRPSH